MDFKSLSILILVAILNFGLNSPALFAAAEDTNTFLASTTNFTRHIFKLFILLHCFHLMKDCLGSSPTDADLDFNLPPEPCRIPTFPFNEIYGDATKPTFVTVERPLSVVCDFHVCHNATQDNIECCRTRTNTVIECVDINIKKNTIISLQFPIIKTVVYENIWNLVAEQGYQNPSISCEFLDGGLSCQMEKGSLALPALHRSNTLLTQIRHEIKAASLAKNIDLLSEKYISRTANMYTVDDFSSLNDLFRSILSKFNGMKIKLELHAKSINSVNLKSAGTNKKIKTVYIDTQLILDEELYQDDESLILTLSHELGHNKQSSPIIALNKTLVTSAKTEKNIREAYQKYFDNFLAYSTELNADLLGYFAAFSCVNNSKFLPQRRHIFFQNFLRKRQSLNRNEPESISLFPTLFDHPTPLIRYVTYLELDAKMKALRAYFTQNR